MSTNISIWMALSTKGRYHFFVAGDLAEARKMASKVAGQNYRGMTRIPSTHRLHKQAQICLGL